MKLSTMSAIHAGLPRSSIFSIRPMREPPFDDVNDVNVNDIYIGVEDPGSQ